MRKLTIILLFICFALQGQVPFIVNSNQKFLIECDCFMAGTSSSGFPGIAILGLDTVILNTKKYKNYYDSYNQLWVTSPPEEVEFCGLSIKPESYITLLYFYEYWWFTKYNFSSFINLTSLTLIGSFSGDFIDISKNNELLLFRYDTSNVYTTKLTVTNLNHILEKLDSFDKINGELYIEKGSNNEPTSLTAISNLITKGWTGDFFQHLIE